MDHRWESFIGAVVAPWWRGTRIKEVRDRAIRVGGRTDVTAFASPDGGRPHPRLQVSMPPAQDPVPAVPMLAPLPADLCTAEAFRALLEAELRRLEPRLQASDLSGPAGAAAPGGRYLRNSVASQRKARFFDEARAALDRLAADGSLPAGEVQASRRHLRELEDLAYSGEMVFDDVDIGTYFSFRHDAPFVHYLERLLETLPAAGSPAEALLGEHQVTALARQRTQLTAHLDHLMRHFYAYTGVVETDIERSVGALLIHRGTRALVSMVQLAPGESATAPGYEVLRVAGTAPGPHAGRFLHRDPAGTLRFDDGSPAQVPAEQVERTPVPAEELTFRRAPDDPRLREGMMLDWDGDGVILDQPLSWLDWAGFCDVKAVMEQLGLALEQGASLTEYRSDTGEMAVFDRQFFLELTASLLELGSVYQRLDGGGRIMRGIQRQGGIRARNLPDRLLVRCEGQAGPFCWPPDRTRGGFRMVGLKDAAGNELDLESAFFTHTADVGALEIRENPRFSGRERLAYHLCKLQPGETVEAETDLFSFHPETGHLVHQTAATTLRFSASPGDEPCYLGSTVESVERRELRTHFLDPVKREVASFLYQYRLGDGGWAPVELPDRAERKPLPGAWECTLGHEVRRDDPAQFRKLLEQALRSGQNINADTEMEDPVWNGTVLRLASRRQGKNPQNGVEHWRLELTARFGEAALDYLVRRGPDGEPDQYCQAPGPDGWEKAPDYLWQQFPDIGSKGVERDHWVANEQMMSRGIIQVEPQADTPAGFYVHDDHVKNLLELLYCALDGWTHTIVHDNKRHGFRDLGAFLEAVGKLQQLRADVELQQE